MIELRNSETILKLRIAVCHKQNINASANSSDHATQKAVDAHLLEWLVLLALKSLSYDTFGLEKHIVQLFKFVAFHPMALVN